MLDPELMQRHCNSFAATDEELYANAVDNAHAYDFLKDNVPLFECPDADITRTYYFRWWTYRKHLRKTSAGWVVTEFLPPVGWAGAENTISCAMGHHLREGRWLRFGGILDDYTRFMLEKGNVTGPRSYVCWPAWSTLERLKVSGERDIAISMLPKFVRRFDECKAGWTLGRDFRTGQNPATGLFSMDCGHEGTECALSVDGARPMVNAAMWAEASAISRIAELSGDDALASRFRKEAAVIENAITSRLWHAERKFFTAVTIDGSRDAVRELHGYAPFYFKMPLKPETMIFAKNCRFRNGHPEKGKEYFLNIVDLKDEVTFKEKSDHAVIGLEVDFSEIFYNPFYDNEEDIDEDPDGDDFLEGEEDLPEINSEGLGITPEALEKVKGFLDSLG